MWMLVAPVLAWAVTPDQVPNPRDRGSWVVDLAEVLDAETLTRLDERIEALNQELTVEIAVVVVPTVEDTPKAFTTALFERWGIGRAGADNGLLVVLAMAERRVEMETGYGLEPVLPDSWLGEMQAREMVPRFKDGDYPAGLEAGLAATDAKLREHPLEARLGRLGRDIPTEPWPDRPATAFTTGVEPEQAAVVSLGGAFGVLAIGSVAYVRRRRRTCPECDVYMPKLDESADDAHLDAGQRTEESIGSVDWQVHTCPTCDHLRTFRRARWFSGYSSCPSCKYRARSSKRRTISAASYTSSGLAEVTESCAHCSYSNRYTVTIPKKERPSTSSSSSSRSSGSSFGSSSRSSSGSSSRSGSSFGGGRSGGGGAGSSW